MTTYVINSALVALTGTVNADEFILNTASEVSLYGLEGNDTISGGAGVVGMNLASMLAGDGDDLIRFTGGGGITASKASINLGNGNDRFSADISAAPEFTLFGGQGNDTIVISGVAGLVMRSSRIIGGGGNDVMDVSLGSGTSFWLAGGGGNDSITFSATTSNLDLISGTLAGGGGADIISANFVNAPISALYLAGDDPRTLDSEWDGNDRIVISGGSGIEASTVNGQGGNDTITIDAIATANLINGNPGNDSINITNLTAAVITTIAGGAGSDQLTFSSFNSVGSGLLVQGGGDNDTISLSASLSNTSISIAGGDGGDTFNLAAAGTFTASRTGQREGFGLFYYGSFTESTAENTDLFSGIGSGSITGLDIGISGVTGTVAANTANTAVGCAISGGVAIFTSTISQALATRVSILDGLVTTQGAGVLFSTVSNDGSSNNYLFVQGGSNDLVVRFAAAEATALTAISGAYHIGF